MPVFGTDMKLDLDSIPGSPIVFAGDGFVVPHLEQSISKILSLPLSFPTLSRWGKWDK